MKNESLWNSYLESSKKELKEDISCDVLIIGGGLSGLLTAYYLKDSNLQVTVVERNKIGSGITSKMTGKVTLLQDILSKISDKDIELYIKSQIDGLNLLKKNIEENKLDCDFFKNVSYLFTTKKSNQKKLEKIKNIFEKLKLDIKEDNLNIHNIKVKYALKMENAYEINPIKYLNEIRKLLTNVNIYEKVNVLEIIKEKGIFTVKTSNNLKIIAKKIVFATNYPYFLKPLFFPLKVRMEKSYIGYGDTSLELKERFNAINIDKDKYSLRFYKNKMLYLRESRIISSKVNDEKGFLKIKNDVVLKNINNLWSNEDIVTNDNLPIIGMVSDGMYILTGYNAWGILSSHIGSLMIANMIKKRKKYLKYQELFSPKMKLSLKKFLNSSLNIYESINGYLKGIITKNKLILYSRDKAIYVADNGYCYLVKRKCPHLKCNLIFNSVEKTWDCPCHGSRFDLEGNVIAGPSKYDIKVKSVK